MFFDKKMKRNNINDRRREYEKKIEIKQKK